MAPEALDGADEITSATRRLLKAAGFAEALPTPVDRLLEVSGLCRGTDDLFDDATLAEAPGYLQTKIRQLRGKVRAMLDRREREVYINPAVTVEAQRRFKTLHEVGHHILPSQQDLAFADDESTLSWTTKVRLERDANQAAAELLFQGELFACMAASDKVGIATVVDLAQRLGASYHAALRRYVETHRVPVAAVVLEHGPCGIEPLAFRRRETVSSAAWGTRFEPPQSWPPILQAPLFPFVEEAQLAARWKTTATSSLRWIDRDQVPVDLNVEIFSNTYSLLVLVWVPQRERLKRSRRLVPSPAAIS